MVGGETGGAENGRLSVFVPLWFAQSKSEMRELRHDEDTKRLHHQGDCKRMAIVHFASTEVERIEEAATLPAKFERMLNKYPLKSMVEGKTVAVKMHLGLRIVTTTIHPIFVGILPLRSAKHADYIHNEIPDMFVPESVREAMRKSGTEGARIGVEMAQRFLIEAKPLVQGAYLMPPFNKFEMAVDVMSVLADRELS